MTKMPSWDVRRNKAKPLLIVFWLVGLVCTGWAVHIVPRFRLGYRANEVSHGATRVEAFRVVAPFEEEDLESDVHGHGVGPATPKIDGYFIIATAPGRGRDVADAIGNVLLDDATYTSMRLDCLPQPGVVFRIGTGAESLHVILCFHCGEIQTVTHDGDGTSRPGVYTLMAGNSRRAFVRLAKAAFPRDAEIQKL